MSYSAKNNSFTNYESVKARPQASHVAYWNYGSPIESAVIKKVDGGFYGHSKVNNRRDSFYKNVMKFPK